MKQADFERSFEPRWNEFGDWLDRHDGKPSRGSAVPRFDDAGFPARYREICQHLALARDRHYGADLVERLNQLALRGHHALYGERGVGAGRMLDFIAWGFPALVRVEWRATVAGMLLFFGPLVAITLLAAARPDAAYYLVDPELLGQMREMYGDRAEALGRRGAESDVAMFAFYVSHNTGIGFQTFGGGMLLGLGTIFFLVFNGLQIGAVAGFLTSAGLGGNFWGFVAGHSAPELLAIGISGAAGFRLAQALLAPGPHSRRHALALAGSRAIRLMAGAALMFVIAAFIEGFWSPHRWLPTTGKLAAGATLWVLFLAYFGLAGRGRRTRS